MQYSDAPHVSYAAHCHVNTHMPALQAGLELAAMLLDECSPVIQPDFLEDHFFGPLVVYSAGADHQVPEDAFASRGRVEQEAAPFLDFGQVFQFRLCV